MGVALILCGRTRRPLKQQCRRHEKHGEQPVQANHGHCLSEGKIGSPENKRDDGHQHLSDRRRTCAYFKDGQYARAVADWDAMLTLNPSTPSVRHWRGVAKRLNGDTAGGDIDVHSARNERPTIEAEMTSFCPAR